MRPWKTDNWAAHGSWRTSTQSECDVTFGYCSGKFVELLFHTSEEDAPWAELDLGRPRSFSSIAVRNREDCCKDRAVPLVVQVSNDGASWKEIGRKTTEFDTWDLTFPTENARYLRFSVERRTMFHLKSVTVR
jgi:F5/8 type C domain